MWNCLNCTEQVPDEFEVCWKCEANREGRMPVLNLSGEDLEDESQKDFLNEKFRPKNCVRCNVLMTYAGRQEFHEGTMWETLELQVNRTNLEMYFCPSCLRVEFFLSDPNY